MVNRNQVEINGQRISYLQSGKGKEIILFIHGSGMDAEGWGPQLEDEKLASHFTLVAIDLPGHGKSGWSNEYPSGYHPKNLAELIKSLIELLNFESFLLVGLSLGTTIIGEITPPLPGCVGIVLASTCLFNDQNLPGNILTPGPHGHVMASSNATDEDIRAFVYSHMTEGPISEKYICDYKRTDPTFREQLGKFFVEGSWSNEIANIQAWHHPVCIAMGENDSLMKIGYLDSFSPLWSDKVYYFKNSGHFLTAEQSAQFNELLFSYAMMQFK